MGALPTLPMRCPSDTPKPSGGPRSSTRRSVSSPREEASVRVAAGRGWASDARQVAPSSRAAPVACRCCTVTPSRSVTQGAGVQSRSGSGRRPRSPTLPTGHVPGACRSTSCTGSRVGTAPGASLRRRRSCGGDGHGQTPRADRVGVRWPTRRRWRGCWQPAAGWLPTAGCASMTAPGPCARSPSEPFACATARATAGATWASAGVTMAGSASTARSTAHCRRRRPCPSSKGPSPPPARPTCRCTCTTCRPSSPRATCSGATRRSMGCTAATAPTTGPGTRRARCTPWSWRCTSGCSTRSFGRSTRPTRHSSLFPSTCRRSSCGRSSSLQTSRITAGKRVRQSGGRTRGRCSCAKPSGLRRPSRRVRPLWVMMLITP